MIADGIEVDMNLRNSGTPKIRRHEMMDDSRQDGVQVMFTKHGHKSLSGSHFITFITFIVGLLLTPWMAEASHKITNTISVRAVIQGNQIMTMRTKTAISVMQD